MNEILPDVADFAGSSYDQLFAQSGCRLGPSGAGELGFPAENP